MLVLMMAINSELVEKKAKLISAGEIHKDKGTKLPYYPSKSTGGPDAGRVSITLALDEAQEVKIKLALTDDPEAPYQLTANERSFAIIHDGEVFLEGVTVVPTLLHAPGQAFINLTPECRYKCLFCASPELGENAHVKARKLDDWVKIIIDASNRPGFRAVAITSGVPDEPSKTVDDIIYVVNKVREALPDAPIGVEPCIDRVEDIQRLHDAGVTELKINVQTYDPELFAVVCPGFDRKFILDALAEAVSVFGQNKVCSNLIIGLGEADGSIKEGMEHLAKLGVVVNLRVLRLNDYNRPKLEELLPGGIPEPVPYNRILELVKFQNEMFSKYDLSSKEFETMCHKCGACDIDPSLDIDVKG
jgi:biotin synthase-related radical SAM superfamily protein